MDSDASSQANLPELPELTMRKLELKWSDLLERYKLAGEHLRWHDKARLRRDHSSTLTNQIGVVPSINIAEHRFTDLANAYWSIWHPGTPYEVFVGYLESIRRWTSADLESVWKGKSDAIDAWYDKTCGPAVEKELATRVREWTKKARAAELAFIERFGKTSATPIPAVTIDTQDRLDRVPVSPNRTSQDRPKLNLELIRKKFMEKEG